MSALDARLTGGEGIHIPPQKEEAGRELPETSVAVSKGQRALLSE